MHLAANEKDKKYFKSPPWTQTFCVSLLCTEFKSLRVSAFLCELHAGRGGMQICDTTCHAMITRKHVAMETAITIVRRHISVAFLEQNCDEFGARPLYRDSLGKVWRYKCLIHISRHRVSCLSFRWESCKFLYLLAVVTIDRTDWSQNPLGLINPLSVFFIFLLRNSKYHSRFSSYDLVFGYETLSALTALSLYGDFSVFTFTNGSKLIFGPCELFAKKISTRNFFRRFYQKRMIVYRLKCIYLHLV